MFGLRNDGKKVKKLPAVTKIVPHIMKERNDSQNLLVHDVNCEILDDFIRAQRENGVSYNYMHIVVAATVRMFYLRNELNRFVMNGRIYDRYSKDGKNISVSFTVKKFLSDAAPDTTIKVSFSGHETLHEIKEIIDEAIKNNTTTKSAAIKDINDADKLARFLTNIPNGLIKLGVGMVKWLDKHGCIPRKVLSVSPFHSSVYITNLKSIKTGYIYHHLYNFGTVSMFISMGKEKKMPLIDENDNIVVGKIMQLGFTLDERITDGFYYAKSLRQFKEIMEHPEKLVDSIKL